MKIVAGLSKASLKSRALEQSIKTVNAPNPIATWLVWFDTQPCDRLNQSDKKSCEGCKDKDLCSGGEGQGDGGTLTKSDMFNFAYSAVERFEAMLKDYVKSLNPASVIHPDLQSRIHEFKAEFRNEKEALRE